MKKYTDTELLEKILPMLNYSITIRADAVSVCDTVDFGILESSAFVSKSFVVALQNRINELVKKARVEATNITVDEDNECNNRWDDCEEATCSSRKNHQLKKEIIELKDTIKLMESDNYRDRFKAEYYQVKIRHDKLGAMLKKYEKNELDFKPKCSFSLLLQQYIVMWEYLDLLKLRADIEEVRLED